MPRTVRPRTEDQIKQDLEKIEKYRALEDRFRQQVTLPPTLPDRVMHPRPIWLTCYIRFRNLDSTRTPCN